MSEANSHIPNLWSSRRSDDAERSRDVTSSRDVTHENLVTRTHLNVKHGGIVRSFAAIQDDFIDASASINPLGPPDWLRQELERAIEQLVHYPDPEALGLRSAIAQRCNAMVENVVVGNGASELLAWLPQVTGGAEYVVPVPSYGEYRRSPALAERRVHWLLVGRAPHFALDYAALDSILEDGQATGQVVLLGHPNNPTGKLLDLEQLDGLCHRHPRALFVIDEAFADFVEGFVSAWTLERANVLVLRSLTKNLAIPGLRLGYALGPEQLIACLRARLPPWSVNLLAQRVGERYLKDSDSALRLREKLAPLKADLIERLEALPRVRVCDSAANWVLVELLEARFSARDVTRSCRERGIALRPCDDFLGLEGQWLRIALRTATENRRIVDTLRDVLGAERAPVAKSVKRPHALMLGGCTSDAGKSLLATALCRCLHQDGYRVAPFKAQNMSNNAGVAADGGEMGRAQIVQARAACVTPDTRMNPVLLKPMSDRGAQVIVRGQALGHRDVLGHHALRQHCLDASLNAYDALAEEYDVIVCEGAGSIGEMNLRARDIANLGFVEQREMPVVLVGDIDRGGVYASFVGHLSVLSESDRRHVRGFLVNRFRGDPSLLGDAHAWLRRHTGRPVLGVVPYLYNVVLPREDRLSLEAGRKHFGVPHAPIHLAVLAPPHVSNADDIEPLTHEPDVYLYVVERPEELGSPTALILLGTKNTLGDLAAYRREGMDRAILRAHAEGTEIVGICGGLQMLGESIEDPEGVESTERQTSGLSLLPVVTRYSREKCVRSCAGLHVPSKTRFSGYEIHHGRTDFSRACALFVDEQGSVLGGGHASQSVWGTYVHGLFDSDEFRAMFLDDLRVRKGLSPLGSARHRYELESTFDHLAEVFRKHVDYPALLTLMGFE